MIWNVNPATWQKIRGSVKNGDEVIFADGEYPYTLDLPASGIYRALNAWRAVVRFAPYYGITWTAPNVTVDGFGVELARGSGMKIIGANPVVARCYVQNCGLSGVEIGVMAFRATFRRCLIQFCGSEIGKHHGLYFQAGMEHKIENCISRHNAGAGVAISGPVRCLISRSLIVRNHWGLWASSIGTKMGAVEDCTILDNHCDIHLDGANYPTDDQGRIQRCIYETMQRVTPAPNVTMVSNDQLPFGFTNRDFGDYRRGAIPEVGWPVANQWASTVGWDQGRPYRFDPMNPMPLSLMPGGE